MLADSERYDPTGRSFNVCHEFFPHLCIFLIWKYPVKADYLVNGISVFQDAKILYSMVENRTKGVIYRDWCGDIVVIINELVEALGCRPVGGYVCCNFSA